MNYDNIEAYFRLMGLEPGTPLSEVKKEYTNLTMSYHPDRFPPGKRQAWANDKLAQLNNAMDGIKEFFKEHPDGKPPNGWPSEQSKATTAPKQKVNETAYETDDDFVNWKDWNKNNSPEAVTPGASVDINEQVILDWRNKEAQRQDFLKKSFVSEGRKTIVIWGKIIFTIFLVLVWTGHRESTLTGERIRQEYKSTTEKTNDYMVSNLRKDPYEANQEEMDMNERHNKERDNIVVAFFWNILLTVLCIWFWFGKKPKAFFERWIETKYEVIEREDA